MKNSSSSGRESTETHIKVRFTALMLIPLIIWLVIFVLNITQTPITEIHKIIISPISLVGVVTTIFISLYHSVLGIQNIIMDYVKCTAGRYTMLYFLYFISIISFIAVVFAIFHLHSLVRISTIILE